MTGHRQRYSVVAHIEKDPAGGAVLLNTTLPHLARGRYLVNRDALTEWRKLKILAPEEKKRLRALLEKIELVNIRQSALFRILEAIVDVQSRYFFSRQKSRMRPLTMRSLASRLGLAASTVCRAARERSVIVPWNEEVAIADLLPSRRDLLEFILDELMKESNFQKLSDSALGSQISQAFGIDVPRRSLNECRRQWQKKTAAGAGES